MKKLVTLFSILTVSLLLLTVCSMAQAPDWSWAKGNGGTGDDDCNHICTDAGGYSYITGNFKSQTISVGGTILTNAGSTDYTDFFVAKFDASGNTVWAKSTGGNEDDGGNSICTDEAGNVYVTGYFRSTSITFGSTTLTKNAFYDLFIVKYSSSGNVVWARGAAAGTDYDEGKGICYQKGHLYITGYFQSPIIVFDNDTLVNTTNNHWNHDIFVVKCDTSGHVEWARSAGGANDDLGIDISTDTKENSYVTGYYLSPTITFDSIAPINCTGNGGWDIFIAKYDSTGDVHWAKGIGGTSQDYGHSVSTDAIGNCYITGNFSSNSISLDTITLTNNGPGFSDIFTAKYDTSGHVLWGKRAGETSEDVSNGIITDAIGNSYITGYFMGPKIVFENDTIFNSATMSFYADVFVTKYNTSGNVVWAKSAGGIYSDDFGKGIGLDPFGNCYISGSFKGNTINVLFGSNTIVNTDNTGSTSDFFIAKLGNALGMNEIPSAQNDLNIFPNPFSTSATVTCSKPLVAGTLFIYDLLGKEIHRMENLQGKEIIIRREGMKSGMYFYSLSDRSGLLGKGKMIVE